MVQCGMNVGGSSEMNDITTSDLVGTPSETSERTETASMISEPGTIREQAQLPTPEDMYRLVETVQQNSDMLHIMREERRANRISDWERQREKDRQTALQHAIQTFPKVSSKEYLPAQLENFTAILDSHGVPDYQRTCQLPGILTGQLAVTFHTFNYKLISCRSNS